MDSIRYIGLDVHRGTISAAVLDTEANRQVDFDYVTTPVGFPTPGNNVAEALVVGPTFLFTQFPCSTAEKNRVQQATVEDVQLFVYRLIRLAAKMHRQVCATPPHLSFVK